MSDAESDEDLRRAIAQSLMSPELMARSGIIDEDDDDLDKPQSCRPIISTSTPQIPLQPKHLLRSGEADLPPITAGLLGLNRRQMENERLARTAHRVRDEDAYARKRKASTSPAQSHDRVREQKSKDVPKPLGDTSTKSQHRQFEAPKLSGAQYPNGTVKKTWALGHDRNGDDIKIEEVLQRSDLEVAVLSSFQVDADCTLSLTVTCFEGAVVVVTTLGDKMC